jgi:hypothetical protein
MTTKAPPLADRSAPKIVEDLDDRATRLPSLESHWPVREGTAGRALVQLFGRLGELLTNRLDQVAGKHFLAFLDSAGLSLTPPVPALAELRFESAEDGPPVIFVPAGTQVLAAATETQPEVVFETGEDLSVVYNQWASCIALDPTSYADRTDTADRFNEDTFPAFRGDTERERLLYLCCGDLLAFSDEAERKSAAVTLRFELAAKRDPRADDWTLEWLGWDGKKWIKLPDPNVRDGTQGFSHDGEIEFTALPEMKEKAVDGLLFRLGLDAAPAGDGSKFVARLTGELNARGMPVTGNLELKVVKPGEAWQVGDKDEHQTHQTYLVVRGEDAIDVLVAGGEIDLTALPEIKETAAGERLFRLEADAAPVGDGSDFLTRLTKELNTRGIPVTGSLTLTVEKPGEAWQVRDKHQTYRVLRAGDAIDVLVARYWLACRLAGGKTRDRLPVLKGVWGRRRITITTDQGTAHDRVFNGVQGNTAFVPVDLESEFFPFGQRPAKLDAFYLMSNEAFSKPRARVTIAVAGLEGIPDGVTSDDLDALVVRWEYYSAKGWTLLGVTRRAGSSASNGLRFADKTRAFTVGLKDEQTAAITFTVPNGTGQEPAFKETAVNGVAGCWIRATIIDGSYNVPALVEGQGVLNTGGYKFHEGRTYAPFIKQWSLAYTGYVSSTPERPLTVWRSRVDGMLRDHCSALDGGKTVAPFAAKEPGPAFYMGFRKAFPAEATISLLMDLDEEEEGSLTKSPIVQWEYWNGSAWMLLQFSDGTRGLVARGYLSFTAPKDHCLSTEFGRDAFWFRGRPHSQLPRAAAGRTQFITAQDGQGKFTLDATGSGASERQEITRYTWRLVSSNPPVADAGEDMEITLPYDRPTGKIWLTAAVPETDDGKPFRYLWRVISQDEDRAGPPAPTPRLRSIRTNTVSALGAETIQDEVLGSSDGKPHQSFTLGRHPIHGEAVIAVLEADRPPKEQLAGLETALRQIDGKAEVILTPAGSSAGGAGGGVWVRWQRVDDFADSSSVSRHYTLDPVTGELAFGDGKHGKIPPAGRDSIRAVRYGTLAGAAAIALAGAIAALRNPTGDLARIQGVTNLEAAVGGADAEKPEEIQERGPQTLKHRRRAVTQDGFEWMARNAAPNEIASAFVRPGYNARGVREAGWVTMLILPKDSSSQLKPRPALVRRVKGYLEERAPSCLLPGDGRPVSHVHVKGPEYITVSVTARIVPVQLQDADDVKLRVRGRLEQFLHPVLGGTAGDGWVTGRDVYDSELHHQIESVPGVDHVRRLIVRGSLHQWRLQLSPTRVVAAGPARTGPSYLFTTGSDASQGLDGHKVSVALRGQFAERGRFLSDDPRVEVDTEGRRWTLVDLDKRYVLCKDEQALHVYQPFTIPVGSQVCTFDKRIRVLLADPVFLETEDLTTLGVYAFKAGDEVTIVAADNGPLLPRLAVKDVHEGTDDYGRWITLALDDKRDLDTARWDALLSADERLRLPIAGQPVIAADRRILRIGLKKIEPHDKVSVIVDNWRDPRLELLTVERIERREDRVFVPEGHLARSGTHEISIALD